MTDPDFPKPNPQEVGQPSEENTVTPDQAIALATSLMQFLQTELGINTRDFFSQVDRNSFGDSEIPIWETVKSIEIDEDPPFNYVYKSTQAFFTGSRQGYRPSDYFCDTHEDAEREHKRNIEDGFESYIRTSFASGDISENTVINRNLFVPDLFYGLMVIAHEPLHPELKSPERRYVGGYEVEEAVVTFLGYQIVQTFLNSNHQTQRLGAKFSKFLAEEMNYFSFLRKAYFTLDALYSSETNRNIMKRTPEQEEVMNQLKEEYGSFFVDPEVRQSHVSEFNNAFLISSISHTGIAVVSDYFQHNAIDTIRFLKDKKYRDSLMPGLTEAISTK